MMQSYDTVKPGLASVCRGRALALTLNDIAKAGPWRGFGNRLLLLLGLLIAPLATAQLAAAPGPGEQLSPLVQRLLEDDLLTDEQRRAIRIFHGQWDELKAEDLSPNDQLRLRVLKQNLLFDGKVKVGSTASLLHIPLKRIDDENLYDLILGGYLAGDPESSFGMIGEVGGDYTSPRWRLLIARCYEDLGNHAKAVEQLAPIREQAQAGINSFKTAEDLTAAAQAVVMLAKLEGRPAADFHLANQMLSKAHEEVDPLYWPAYVVEAQLLYTKGNPQQAMEAISQALSLNPKSSEAWYLFGSMRTRFFDFDSANKAVQELHNINEHHPLADALSVEIALRQKDMDTAKSVIGPALERYPTHRKLMALNAAVQAILYDTDAKNAALAGFQKVAPGNPLAEHEVGRALSDARQYALAEPHLERAIHMLPGWSEPQLALGELYMQWGRLPQAAAQLQAASSLDPFHKEITNQLTLAREMLGYDTIETERFVVRYKPGIDEVLARDVARYMQVVGEAWGKQFDHDLPNRTQVDIMPDDQHFAVRITGMPEIWTIAACMGDVMAMTPPRPGPKRAYGAYNWLNVLGHEYTHVVNLSQTQNRVAHWFTEGCAVRTETTGWQWSQYTLLARCYNNDELFSYDDINWGFIRPTQPHHRSLAYAQSAWIIQYIDEEHGWDKVLKMLELFRQGVGEAETIRRVFNLETDAFMEGFLAWAGKQVQAWGMSTYGVEPADPALNKLLDAERLTEADLEALADAAKKHPDEPALVRKLAEAHLVRGDLETAIELIKRYHTMRPVDPWADRELARYALSRSDAESAIPALIKLDKIEGDAPEYAVELARVYRARKDYEQALHYAERALLREPYNATLRETAATIAVQKGDLSGAAFHVESLELLEPSRAIHPKRLSAIYKRLGRAEDAEAAQKRADALELQGKLE